MLPQWIIEKKRDGLELSEEEIRWFVDQYVADQIPDYQMAALAMAIYFRGMTTEETAVLTDAMMRSGELVDTSSILLTKVDKHSTGGIGDKISLILAPLVASCGMAVPMISGRGLGITGGTLDKLEAIPGYRCDLSEREFLDIVNTCGCSITGQTRALAPADRKLYALRDVTATVPSVPLISASILCKKLAEGIDALVLDVKVGSGAFMKTEEEAETLARTMVEVGTQMGKAVEALLTDMNQPLGRCVGNALEVRESVEVLSGSGAEDLLELTLTLGSRMLMLAGKEEKESRARVRLEESLKKGKALEVFRSMISLHGGNADVCDDAGLLPQARYKEEVSAGEAGIVVGVDAEAIGRACVLLGAGRSKVEDSVDPSVGISDLVKCGERVGEGQPLAIIHANDPALLDQARPLVEEAFQLSGQPPPTQSLVRKIVVRRSYE